MATLLDAAMGIRCRSLLDDDHGVVTVQLSITFANAAKLGDQLIAKPTIIKVGRRFIMMHADLLRQVDGVLIAHGDGTFAANPRSQGLDGD